MTERTLALFERALQACDSGRVKAHETQELWEHSGVQTKYEWMSENGSLFFSVAFGVSE